MSNVLWTAFETIVAAELPGVPLPLIDLNARIVGIQFCEDTQLHVVPLDPMLVVAAVAEYDLEAPSMDTVVSEVLAAWLSGAPLKFIPVSQLRRTGTYWPADTGATQGYTQLNPGSVVLYPIPTANVVDGLKLSVTLKPSRTSTGLEGWIAEKYFYDLANGIKAKLMGMPGQSWTNKEGADAYAAMFAGAVKAAAAAAGRNAPRGRLTE